MSQLSQLQDKFQILFQSLRAKTATVGFAESCTGGLLSSKLTAFSGVSDIYQGSIVSYANLVKINVLKVQSSTIEDFGAVSEATAREMAQGACQVLDSTYALSITGVAGPSGGTEKKPVGTVCFAVCGPGFVTSEIKFFVGDRKQIQMQAVEYGLDYLIKSI